MSPKKVDGMRHAFPVDTTKDEFFSLSLRCFARVVQEARFLHQKIMLASLIKCRQFVLNFAFLCPTTNQTLALAAFFSSNFKRFSIFLFGNPEQTTKEVSHPIQNCHFEHRS
jgi:hypothetical protein